MHREPRDIDIGEVGVGRLHQKFLFFRCNGWLALLARCFNIIAAIARRHAQCRNHKKEIKYLASDSHKRYRYRKKKRIRIKRIRPTGTYIAHSLYIDAPPIPCAEVPYLRHFAENWRDSGARAR